MIPPCTCNRWQREMFSHSGGMLGNHFAPLRAEPSTVVKEKPCRDCPFVTSPWREYDRRLVAAAMVSAQYAQAAAFEAAAAADAQWTN